MKSFERKLLGAMAIVGLLLAGYGLGTLPVPTSGLETTPQSGTSNASETVVGDSVAVAPSAPTAPAVAGAPDVSPETCTGAVGAVQVEEVTVPQSAVCSLDGTQVAGNVTVGQGSVLVARAVTVGGDVEAEGAIRVDVTGRSTVVGNVQVQRGGSSLIAESQIDGDLKWEEQDGLLVVQSSAMSGNLQADGNSGGVFILDNRVEGDLECEENGPVPAGSNNDVLGGAEDCPLADAGPALETLTTAEGTTTPSDPGPGEAPVPLPPEDSGASVPSAAPLPSPPEDDGTLLDFTISSFNVLGSSHTGGSGKRPGMAPGRVRARGAADLVRRHGADVVGFQELQADQLGVLQRRTPMQFFPGDRLRRRDSENSIGWRQDRWKAVELHTVQIPYFDGNHRAMPYIRLRNLQTGRDVWFTNFHNPADTRRFHRQQRFRVRATEVEAALVNRLVRQTGLPVLMTGDMNERTDFFCRITARAPLVAARGGSSSHGCQAGRPRTIDWILGTRDIRFSNYVEDRSRLVHVTTDHPVIAARVNLR